MLRFAMLKFNHAIEVGACLAYMGHYKATKDLNIKEIAEDEVEHRYTIEDMLDKYGKTSSLWLDIPFYLVGLTVGALCHIFPKRLLNLTAKLLEIFAVFSYSKLAEYFPEEQALLLEMSETENRHKLYFSKE